MAAYNSFDAYRRGQSRPRVRRAPSAPRAPAPWRPPAPRKPAAVRRPTRAPSAPRVQRGGRGGYRVQNAPGGTYHVYAGGRRVFVPARTTQQGQAQQQAQGRPVVGRPAPRPPAPPPQLYGDSDYYLGQAQAGFTRDQQHSDLNRDAAYDQQDFQEALRRMAVQRPEDDRRTTESANRQGLLYSGKLGKDLGDVATDYAQREGDQRQSMQRREAGRAAARRSIEAGYTLAEAALAAEAADRQIARDEEAATGGYLADEPDAPDSDGRGPDAAPPAAARQAALRGRTPKRRSRRRSKR